MAPSTGDRGSGLEWNFQPAAVATAVASSRSRRKISASFDVNGSNPARIGSKSCGWVGSGMHAGTESNLRGPEIHPGERRILPLQFARADHPGLQPTLVLQPEEFFAEKNIGRRRCFWQCPQPALDHRYSLGRQHLPGTCQPCSARIGDGRVSRELPGGLQAGTILVSPPTRQAGNSASNKPPSDFTAWRRRTTTSTQLNHSILALGPEPVGMRPLAAPHRPGSRAFPLFEWSITVHVARPEKMSQRSG